MNLIYFIILSVLVVFQVEYDMQDYSYETCHKISVASTVINNRCYDSTSGR